MRFPMPHFPIEFEIPDDWIEEAGMTGFRPSTSAYRPRPTKESFLIPLTQIEPVPRLRSPPKDWRGCDRARLVYVLKEIVAGDEIEPICLEKLPCLELVPSPYRYRVSHSVHRFYGSIAAGFQNIPAFI
jgi:hypothetical protein